MVTKALGKYLKSSAKRVKPVMELVRGKPVDQALYLLFHVKNKAAFLLKNVIESALSNAKRIPEKKFTEDSLYISKITVNQGPSLKRFRSMSMGRAGRIVKRTCHVLVELDALKEVARERKERQAVKKIKSSPNAAKIRK